MVAWHHDEGQKLVAFVREMEKRILNNLRLPFIFQMSDWWIMIKKIVHLGKEKLLFVMLPISL